MDSKSQSNSNAANILIVDDSLDMRIYTKTILKQYNIIEAENGQIALEIIKNNSIDLLITDYLMPKMDGIELLKEIRKENYVFPIIVITSTNFEQKKIEMFRLGIDNYVVKPFFKEELLNIVNRALVYHKTLIKEKSKSKNDDNDKDLENFKNKLETIIYNNVNNFDFSISDIALEFNISTKTLTRKTKLLYGQTPNQLLIECRLLIAQEIINKNPNLTLKQIAEQVGLKNTSYLKNRLAIRFKDS